MVDLASYEVIFYQQPNPKHLQFLALDPLELDISHKPVPHHDQKYVATMENLNKILGYSERIVGAPPPESYDLLSVLVQVMSECMKMEESIDSHGKYRSTHPIIWKKAFRNH